MAELITPTARLHRQWLDARDDWGRGVHQDGSGLQPYDDVDSPTGFAAWVDRITGESDPSRPVAQGRVRATYWWIAEGDTVLGSIALRHELNDFLLRAGGHIGYAVRPSARRRGLAGFALGEVLGHARKLGPAAPGARPHRRRRNGRRPRWPVLADVPPGARARSARGHTGVPGRRHVGNGRGRRGRR